MLEVRDLAVAYGPIRAVRGLSFSVARGEIVALLGANGAGKSSVLKACMGLAPVTGGAITLEGVAVTGSDTAAIVRRRMTLVPEGRRVFQRLSVAENLAIGAAADAGLRRKSAANAEEMYALFPRLAERREQLAGSLSGGEQQMLAIARALMTEPQMLLMDEPSLGLAPNIVDQIFDLIVSLRSRGITLLVVEQNAELALEVADRGIVMAQGAIVREGAARELREADDLARHYLGAA